MVGDTLKVSPTILKKLPLKVVSNITYDQYREFAIKYCFVGGLKGKYLSLLINQISLYFNSSNFR